MTSRALTLVGYGVLALVAISLELMARRSHRVGTLGDTVSVLLRHRPARIVFLAGWLWLGWHVFARADWQ